MAGTGSKFNISGAKKIQKDFSVLLQNDIRSVFNRSATYLNIYVQS